MTTLIEHAVSLADAAKVLKSTAAAVEADCHELDMFIGTDWAGRPAISVTDAAALVSGSARRDHDHATRWQAHTARSGGWETDREAVRREAFQGAYEAALREGRGAPAAAVAGHEAARQAVAHYRDSVSQHATAAGD